MPTLPKLLSVLGVCAWTLAPPAAVAQNERGVAPGEIPAASALRTEAYFFQTFELPGAMVTAGQGLDDDCVVGYYAIDPKETASIHAFRRCGGTPEIIDPPTSTGDRKASDINASGVVVGSAQRAQGHDGFELDGSTYTWLEYPGADGTLIHGINDDGDLVGEYETGNGFSRGFARLGGSLVTIDMPLASETRARGINNFDEIVGSFRDRQGRTKGFLRTADGTFTTLEFSGVVESEFNDINDVGEIVGTFMGVDGVQRGFLITSPLVQFLTFDVPGSVTTLANGIGEDGELAGEWLDTRRIRRAFVARIALFADGFEAGNTDAWSSTQP